MEVHTLGADDTGLASGQVEVDGLVTAVHARHVTAAATDTLVAVNLRIYNRVAIQVVRIRKRWQRFTHNLMEFADATLGQL